MSPQSLYDLTLPNSLPYTPPGSSSSSVPVFFGQRQGQGAAQSAVKKEFENNNKMDL